MAKKQKKRVEVEVKKVPVEKLRPFKGNPKKHPPEQIKKIIKSLKEYGWTNPILATRDGMVVAGHARLEAAKKAGIKEVPVIYLPFGGKKAVAYLLADNKLAESDWDFTQLVDLLIELDTGEFDMTLTGFDEKELREIMNEEVPQMVDYSQRDEFEILSFLVSREQREVIERAINRICRILDGKNKKGRALELMAADSLNTPLESFQ